MTTATRKAPAKKAAAARKKTPAKKAVPAPVKEIAVSDAVETPETAEAAPKRKGPKPNPVSRVRRAKAALVKARSNAAKVEKYSEALAVAEAEFKEAVAALQASLDDLDIDTDTAGDADADA
ncbi:hypothetical protein [Streptomyces sp. S1]|uniref:hypothetical protein n=1 Tax=Streptomyces sp. S1 TaxID=718288 RepID=UPI003D731AD2